MQIYPLFYNNPTTPRFFCCATLFIFVPKTMKIYSTIPILLGLLALLLAGCGQRGAFVPGEVLYEPRYAQGFAIYEAGERSTAIQIKDPWQGADGVEQWVFVSREGEAAPEGFTGQTVAEDAERIVCMSSSYVAFLAQLGCSDRVMGVSGLDFVTNPEIRQRGAVGDVADVGYEASLNFEVIASLRPDVVLMYGVGDDGGAVTAKYREMGVPYVFVAEYLEADPLGKAEWIVALAHLTGDRERGIDEFEKIEQAYNTLKNTAMRFAARPAVMLNVPYRDTWYVPGDESYMVRLLEDAGGRYVCAGVASRDTRPIDIEQAYMAIQQADVWLNTNHYNTLAELTADNPRFASTPPVRDRRVFNNNARTTPAGGSDFWESGVVRPDLVLADLVKILHPEAAADSLYYYYRRLE
jgi:iron complex transport system substrate-binding protein